MYTEESNLKPVSIEVDGQGEFQFSIRKGWRDHDPWTVFLEDDDQVKFIVDLLKGQSSGETPEKKSQEVKKLKEEDKVLGKGNNKSEAKKLFGVVAGAVLRKVIESQ